MGDLAGREGRGALEGADAACQATSRSISFCARILDKKMQLTDGAVARGLARAVVPATDDRGAGPAVAGRGRGGARGGVARAVVGALAADQAVGLEVVVAA